MSNGNSGSGSGGWIVLLLVLAGAGAWFFYIQPARDQGSILEVLKADSKTTAGAKSVAEVVSRMRAIDQSHCPNDFKASYLAHIHAWEMLADVETDAVALKADSESGATVVESFLRGFLGDPFGKANEIQNAQTQLQRKYQAAIQQIKLSFQHVEETAVLHGATLPPPGTPTPEDLRKTIEDTGAFLKAMGKEPVPPPVATPPEVARPDNEGFIGWLIGQRITYEKGTSAWTIAKGDVSDFTVLGADENPQDHIYTATVWFRAMARGLVVKGLIRYKDAETAGKLRFVDFTPVDVAK